LSPGALALYATVFLSTDILGLPSIIFPFLFLLSGCLVIMRSLCNVPAEGDGFWFSTTMSGPGSSILQAHGTRAIGDGFDALNANSDFFAPSPFPLKKGAQTPRKHAPLGAVSPSSLPFPSMANEAEHGSYFPLQLPLYMTTKSPVLSSLGGIQRQNKPTGCIPVAMSTNHPLVQPNPV
jgi:hypothetical protein